MDNGPVEKQLKKKMYKFVTSVQNPTFKLGHNNYYWV